MLPNGNHDAHDYAERIRGRLPLGLQRLRVAAGLSKYALERKSRVSREMIARIEGGGTIPTLHVSARLAHGMGMTLEQFVGGLEDGLA